ncbi:MAG TPA: Gfo/Idh/MocA family oxidoreductase [Pyrinomonadaceae bacterium]|nr:Gfo/Idh/MocA family oxidoreductase [Pyrinomonadaceae bacterium]
MINLGIIGAGNISDTHARAAREIDGVEVAAIYGHNQEKAVRLAGLYGGTVYTDLDAFLNHEPLDVVMIGSPSGLHASQGIAAAQRGLHVLVEKPIDITTGAADLLIKVCKQAGVKLGVCFQDRVAPDIVRLKEVLDAGRLGKPILVSGRVKWYRPPEYYRNSRWRGTSGLDGGGALINQGIHTVDLLLWLMGDVTRVNAKTITALHDIEVEDTVVATLEFASGAIGTLESATSAYPGYPRRIELTGSEGTILVEDSHVIAADFRNQEQDLVGSRRTTEENTPPRASSPVVSDVSGHKKILEDFLRAIETDGRPLCDGHEGRRIVELVEAIYESSRTGKAVAIVRVLSGR